MLKVREKASAETVNIEPAIAVNIPREPSAPSPKILGYATNHSSLTFESTSIKKMRELSN